jgi:hypothetical protein
MVRTLSVEMPRFRAPDRVPVVFAGEGKRSELERIVA